MKFTPIRIVVFVAIWVALMGLPISSIAQENPQTKQLVAKECTHLRVVSGGVVTIGQKEETDIIISMKNCPDVISLAATEGGGIHFSEGITFTIDREASTPTSIRAKVTATREAVAGWKGLFIQRTSDYKNVQSPSSKMLKVSTIEATEMRRDIESRMTRGEAFAKALHSRVQNLEATTGEYHRRLEASLSSSMVTQAQIEALVNAKVEEKVALLRAEMRKDLTTLSTKIVARDEYIELLLHGQQILGSRMIPEGGLKGLLGKKDFADLSLSRDSKKALEAMTGSKIQKQLATLEPN